MLFAPILNFLSIGGSPACLRYPEAPSQIEIQHALMLPDIIDPHYAKGN